MIHKDIMSEFMRQVMNAECELTIKKDDNGVVVIDKDKLIVMTICGENTLYVNGGGKNFNVLHIDRNKLVWQGIAPNGEGVFLFPAEIYQRMRC